MFIGLLPSHRSGQSGQISFLVKFNMETEFTLILGLLASNLNVPVDRGDWISLHYGGGIFSHPFIIVDSPCHLRCWLSL